jgi:hypothetical protein
MTTIDQPPLTPYRTRLRDRLAEFGWRLREALTDWRDNRALRRELAALDRGWLLGSTLKDVGLSCGELAALADGYPRRSRLFERMRARLRIARPSRAEQVDLLTGCSGCTETRRCRRWLDAGRRTGFEAFCPNAPTLKRLAADRWR